MSPLASAFGSNPLTMVLIGFVMAMTAPIELLYAIKQGLGPAMVTLFIVTSAVGLILVDISERG